MQPFLNYRAVISLLRSASIRRPRCAFSRFLGLAAAAIMLAGCWSSSAPDSEPEPEAEAKELKTSKDPLSTEVPEAELVALSKKLYQVGMYTVSRDSLASLKDRYPLGAYATFAECKHADSYFFNREYNEAAKAYENIIKNYPGSPDLPYVKLQAARAHVASARDAGRDRQPWERGLAIYDDIVAGYPDSSYAAVAHNERALVVDELAAYDREIIEFYRSQGNQPAVDAREKQFAARWGARLAGAASGSHDSGGGKPLRELTFTTAASHPEPVQAAPTTSESTPLDPTQHNDTVPLPEGAIAIQSIQCQNSDVPFATIEVTRLPESLQLAGVLTTLSPTNGAVRLDNLGLTARQTTWDCFGEQDVEIGADGSLLIKTERDLIVATLSDPPRILLTLGN